MKLKANRNELNGTVDQTCFAVMQLQTTLNKGLLSCARLLKLTSIRKER